MTTRLDDPILDGPTITGPLKLTMTTMAVSATVKSLPANCSPLVRLIPSVTGSQVAMPASFPAYTPSTSAVNPTQGGNVPRKDDTYIIWNSHATNTLQLRQPDGTTALGAPFANGAVLVTCIDPNSANAGYAIIPLI
jgi:hypothetical protein